MNEPLVSIIIPTHNRKIKLLKDERLRLKLSRNSLKWARRFSWDKSAREFMKVIEGLVNG
jgi:glycosyltransferase involved in cell wall biosynthesis